MVPPSYIGKVVNISELVYNNIFITLTIELTVSLIYKYDIMIN